MFDEVLTESAVDENDAAIILGVSKREIRWLTQNGSLRTVRVTGQIMYSRSSLVYFAWLDAQKSLDYGPCG